MTRMLVIDDEPSICWGLEKLAADLGYQVQTASAAEQVLAEADAADADVVLLDVRLPGMSGLDAIEPLRKRFADAPIIIMTAYGDLQTAVEAVRRGAFEYVVKPFDLQKIEHVVERAVKHCQQVRARRESGARPQAEAIANQPDGLVGATPVMQEVFRRVALVAERDACVLLAGESGTGKELVARAIHRYSQRSDGPFVAVNVAALSPSLAESELFGHVRGAFTGADQDKVGLLAQADGGTLFLDEVADIPLSLQVKLLRALEHGEVTPVGSSQAVESDFRVISATHQSLREQVQSGDFRHDLYFRLCTFEIELPPLRQRRDDIARLAAHFLQVFSSRATAEITPAALAELERRPWYGNVRELRNAVEHAVIVARDGAIAVEHLPPPAELPIAAPRGEDDISGQIAAMIKRWAEKQLAADERCDELYQRLLDLVEPPLFETALARHHNQVAAAARILGMHRATLRKKLDQHAESAPGDK